MEENNNIVESKEVEQDNLSQDEVDVKLPTAKKKKSKTVFNIILVILILLLLINSKTIISMINPNTRIKSNKVVDKKENKDISTTIKTTTINTSKETIRTTQKPETITKEPKYKIPTNLKQGQVTEKLKDMDYSKYSFIVDLETKEDYKYIIDNYSIIIQVMDEDELNDYKMYINNKLFFEGDLYDYLSDHDYVENKSEIFVHIYGKYFVIQLLEDNITADDRVFIITPENKVIDISNEVSNDTFTKDRIRFHSYIQVQDEEGDCELILTPDEEKKKTIYSSYIIYEYKNGILDTKGKKTDIVSLYDYYKDRDTKVYQEEYDYCKEHWGNKSE